MEILDRHYSNSRKPEFKINSKVLTRLASAFSENRVLKKTHLHLASRINWSSFEKYLNWLKNNNYIELVVHEKEKEYQLTEKGREMFILLLKFQGCVESGTS